MPEAAARGNGASRRSAGRKTVNLALQGGGSHGAFTWGVLDALLEDGRLRFEGVSGTSAGAMNAVVMVNALAQARASGLRGQAVNEAARAGLARFWDGVGLMGAFMSGLPLPAAQAMGSWFSQWFTPHQTNPLGLNPLRSLLDREVDFELVASQRWIKVFVAATNVRTGRGEIFSGKRISCASVMASACLPTLFQAVEVEGEYYWDGGYSGNPAIYPLIYETRSADVVLVQINPIESSYKPGAAAHEIMERVNEITFNASLLAEMRAIEFVSRLLAEGKLDRDRYKDLLVHRVDGGAALAEFGAASKARADTGFLRRLFALGRETGRGWLDEHFDDVGARASIKKIHHAAP